MDPLGDEKENVLHRHQYPQDGDHDDESMRQSFSQVTSAVAASLLEADVDYAKRLAGDHFTSIGASRAKKVLDLLLQQKQLQSTQKTTSPSRSDAAKVTHTDAVKVTHTSHTTPLLENVNTPLGLSNRHNTESINALGLSSRLSTNQPATPMYHHHHQPQPQSPSRSPPRAESPSPSYHLPPPSLYQTTPQRTYAGVVTPVSGSPRGLSPHATRTASTASTATKTTLDSTNVVHECGGTRPHFWARDLFLRSRYASSILERSKSRNLSQRFRHWTSYALRVKHVEEREQLEAIANDAVQETMDFLKTVSSELKKYRDSWTTQLQQGLELSYQRKLSFAKTLLLFKQQALLSAWTQWTKLCGKHTLKLRAGRSHLTRVQLTMTPPRLDSPSQIRLKRNFSGLSVNEDKMFLLVQHYEESKLKRRVLSALALRSSRRKVRSLKSHLARVGEEATESEGAKSFYKTEFHKARAKSKTFSNNLVELKLRHTAEETTKRYFTEWRAFVRRVSLSRSQEKEEEEEEVVERFELLSKYTSRWCLFFRRRNADQMEECCRMLVTKQRRNANHIAKVWYWRKRASKLLARWKAHVIQNICVPAVGSSILCGSQSDSRKMEYGTLQHGYSSSELIPSLFSIGLALSKRHVSLVADSDSTFDWLRNRAEKEREEMRLGFTDKLSAAEETQERLNDQVSKLRASLQTARESLLHDEDEDKSTRGRLSELFVQNESLRVEVADTMKELSDLRLERLNDACIMDSTRQKLEHQRQRLLSFCVDRITKCLSMRILVFAMWKFGSCSGTTSCALPRTDEPPHQVYCEFWAPLLLRSGTCLLDTVLVQNTPHANSEKLRYQLDTLLLSPRPEHEHWRQEVQRVFKSLIDSASAIRRDLQNRKKLEEPSKRLQTPQEYSQNVATIEKRLVSRLLLKCIDERVLHSYIILWKCVSAGTKLHDIVDAIVPALRPQPSPSRRHSHAAPVSPRSKSLLQGIFGTTDRSDEQQSAHYSLDWQLRTTFTALRRVQLEVLNYQVMFQVKNQKQSTDASSAHNQIVE